ncbi:unnamed protein product [Closterium sp. NIES-54]
MPVLSISAYRARLSRALAPAAPAVTSPLLSRPVPSPLLSRPVAPAVASPLPLHRPCCPIPSRPDAPAVASPLLSRPVPSPLLSRRVIPCCHVVLRRSLLSHRIALSVLSRPVGVALPVPEFLTAIKARYATPTTVSLGRLFPPFLFPDLALFERIADLITHLRSLDSSYRIACTLASGAVPPPLFHGCTVPELHTFNASLTTAATDVTVAAFMTSSRSRGRSGRKGDQGVGGGGGGDVASGGGESAGAGGAPCAAAGDSPAAAGGSDARRHQHQQQPLPSQQPQQQQRQQQVSGQGSGHRQLQHGVVHPPCTYHVLIGARRGQNYGRSHPLGTPHAMYGVVDSSASDSVYSSVLNLGASLVEVLVASVGTCVDTSPGAAPEDASLSFTLDSGASHCFFRDRTTLTPLPMPVSGALADPNSGPVTTHYTTTLLCPAVPSGSLTSFHVPSFSRNLVPVSGPVAASCSCRPLAHPTVLWHHRTGHPSISCLCAMSSQCLVLGLTRVFLSFPPLLTPPNGPYVEGRLRATPHSSSLRPATEPFETLHLDVWGPASRPGPERESFFLVVVDDYSCYTTMFPLAKKSDVTSTLIRWLLTTADTRGCHVNCLHSDRGGEFHSGVLAGFCREHGIRQSWMLPESPQQNGVAERRISLVMEIAHTSMTHARAPHFLWPYAVRYAAHQLNLWPRVSQPEVSLTCLWTGSPDKISPRAVPCVFLGFPEDSSNYTFYHPPLHQFFDSRDVRFDESVPYYPPSPHSSSQPTADPEGAVFRGEDPGGASSRGAGVGAESVPVRGFGYGGAGVGAEPVTVGDSSLRGAGVSGAVPRGATTGGAPSAGPREPWTDPVTSSGAGFGVGTTGSLESGPGATTAPDTTPPPHPYLNLHQASVRHAREEQLELEREERELEQQQLSGLGFESQCVHFGHPSAGGCQSSTGDPRLILGKGYDLVVLGGYGRTDPLLNKPFYPNGLVVGILTAGATAAGGAAAAATPAARAGVAAAAAAVARASAAAAAGGAEVAAAVGAAAAATSSSCLWSSDPRSPLSLPPSPPSPPVSGPPLTPPDPSQAAFPPPLPPLSPPLSHTWPSRRSPRARPSSPFPFTDLRTALFFSSLPRSSPFVLPSPLESSLIASLSTPVTDYYRTYCPVLSRVLASLVIDVGATLRFAFG